MIGKEGKPRYLIPDVLITDTTDAHGTKKSTTPFLLAE
jgi:hypothetical protein